MKHRQLYSQHSRENRVTSSLLKKPSHCSLGIIHNLTRPQFLTFLPDRIIRFDRLLKALLYRFGVIRSNRSLERYQPRSIYILNERAPPEFAVLALFVVIRTILCFQPSTNARNADLCFQPSTNARNADSVTQQYHCKRYAEEYLIESGLNYTIIQPSHYLDMFPVERLMQQPEPTYNANFDPNITFSFAILRDLAEAFVKVIEEREMHYLAEYIICSTCPTSYMDVHHHAQPVERQSHQRRNSGLLRSGEVCTEYDFERLKGLLKRSSRPSGSPQNTILNAINYNFISLTTR